MTDERASTPRPVLYPWLTAAWQTLMHARSQDRMPHALLINAAPGIGKWDFSCLLAHGLLCISPLADGQPCGSCHQCQLSAAGSQPDLLIVEPEEAGKALLVDQIRSLCRELALKSHGGGYKIALIRPAERMNTAAANSLLKTLEEPTDNTLLVLVTERPMQLTATIRSRCQRINLTAPSRAEALDWLNHQGGAVGDQAGLLLDLSAGAPLAALALAGSEALAARQERLAQLESVLSGKEDPLAIAALWAKDNVSPTLLWMQDWIGDMIRISTGGETAALRNSDLRPRLAAIAVKWEATRLYEHMDRITAAVRMSAAGSINRQLMYEDILVAWAQRAG